jgi:hypothetical protein
MIGNFPAVLNFNWQFLKLNRFICNQLPVLPDHSSRFVGDTLGIHVTLCAPHRVLSLFLSLSLVKQSFDSYGEIYCTIL